MLFVFCAEHRAEDSNILKRPTCSDYKDTTGKLQLLLTGEAVVGVYSTLITVHPDSDANT